MAFSKADALVAVEHRVAAADLAVALADPPGTWVISKRPSSRSVMLAAEMRRRPRGRSSDEVRLEAAGLGALHLLADRRRPARRSRCPATRALALEQLQQVGAGRRRRRPLRTGRALISGWSP